MSSTSISDPHFPVEAYDAFAYAYDAALGKRFFHAVRPFLIRALQKHPVVPRTHLDLGCGTGLGVEFFRQEGWESIGLDASIPMLELARRRRARVTAADFRRLPFRGRFGCITSLYDSLNHMLVPDALVETFHAVRQVMTGQSILLFDMNHPDVYESVWASPEPFVARGIDFRLEMATKYDKERRAAEALVTGWARLPDGRRLPIDERRHQRCYSEPEIHAGLAAAGLEAVEVLDFDPYGEREGNKVKLFFICRLRKK